jgi:glycine/D-amino acid oxidase-like deaminating enzyme
MGDAGPAFSSSSWWLDRTPGALDETRTSAELPARADVVVIGAGLTGASVAYHLSQRGVGCVLLDRGGVCAGATGRNGGFLSPGLADCIHTSLDTFGIETTSKLYAYTEQCTAAIERFVLENDIACELRFRGEVELASTPAQAAALERTFRVMQATPGAAEMEWEWWDKETCRARTKSDSYEAGMFRKRCATLWPARLVVGIVRRALALGADMQSHTAVTAVRAGEGGGCVVETERGAIACNYVVHATNAWASELIPALEGVITPVRNQVVVTAPQPPMWDFALCANEGFEYFWQRPDGRLLLGGMRNLTATEEWDCKDTSNPSDIVSKALRSYFQTNFSALATGIEIEQEWAGVLGFSADRNPLIGPLRSRPGEYIAAGYSGNGMPFAFLAGRNVADMIHTHTQGQEQGQGQGHYPEHFVPEAFLPERFGI